LQACKGLTVPKNGCYLDVIFRSKIITSVISKMLEDVRFFPEECWMQAKMQWLVM